MNVKSFSLYLFSAGDKANKLFIMENPIIISQIFGPLFVILGISMIINRSWYQKIFKKIKKAYLSIFIMSIFSFIFGMYIILLHAGFSNIHESFATIIGIILVLKSTFYMLQPNLMQQLTKAFEPLLQNSHYIGTFYLLFGISVSYIAYI